jgi:hypothetical protein
VYDRKAYRDLLELGKRVVVVGYIKAFLTFLAFHCNHIKLNSPKKGVAE